MSRQHLRIFRMGLGRDSIAGLILLVTVGLLCKGELIGPEDIDALVFTDTGAEWSFTYEAWPHVKKICDQYGIRAIYQAKPPRDQQAAWLAELAPLREAMWSVDYGSEAYWQHRSKLRFRTPPWCLDDGGTVEEKAARGYYHRRVDIFEDYKSKKSLIRFKDGGCTENHKVQPNRRLMNDLAAERGWPENKDWKELVLAGERKPHQVLLFIALDEKSRAYDDEGNIVGGAGEAPYYEESIYPLIEMGISKADEQEILETMGLGWVKKSGCVGCKYQGPEHYWALSIEEPDQFSRVEGYEGVAADRNDKMVIFPKMKGRPRLRDAVHRWRAKNPLATVAGVIARDYKRNDRQGRPTPKKKEK